MGRESKNPTYDLNEVKRLAMTSIIDIKTRPRVYIQDKIGRVDYDVLVQDLILSIEPEDFYKSVELKIEPGTWADVYKQIPYCEYDDSESNDWYVKLYIKKGKLLVVLTAVIDGDMH